MFLQRIIHLVSGFKLVDNKPDLLWIQKLIWNRTSGHVRTEKPGILQFWKNLGSKFPGFPIEHGQKWDLRPGFDIKWCPGLLYISLNSNTREKVRCGIIETKFAARAWPYVGIWARFGSLMIVRLLTYLFEPRNKKINTLREPKFFRNAIFFSFSHQGAARSWTSGQILI
jgi:hypothetical protein